MAVGTVQGAAAMKIRARLVQPGFAPYMIGWRTVAVMTALGPVTITAVQVMAAVAHVSIGFQLIMGGSPVGPIRGRFAPGVVKVTLNALGAEIVAVGTTQGAGAVKIGARLINPGLPGEVRVWRAVTVMTILGPVTIAAV